MNKKKLILTLLVRDEEDIIEQNVCYHLNNGVDFIIVTDNGSTDSTIEILARYEAIGKIKVIHEEEHNYNQSEWVSRMASIAIKEYGATHLIHCDADEFWVSKKGNLKSCLPNSGEIFYVHRLHYAPPLDIPKNNHNSINFNKYKYVVTSLMGRKELSLVKRRQIFFFASPFKVITSKDAKAIATGNHDIIDPEGKFKKQVTDDYFVLHFPLRSFSQFETKVINGGTSALKVKNKKLFTHIRKWYEEYLQGNLYEVYEEIALKGDVDEYLSKGLIQMKRVPIKIKYAIKIYTIKSFIERLYLWERTD